MLTISGYVRDTHGEGVADAELKVSIGSQSLEPRAGEPEAWRTDEGGTFLIRLPLSAEQAAVLENPETMVIVQAAKPTYATTRRAIPAVEIAQRNNGFYASLDLTLVHIHNAAFWIATIVLIATYVLISTEKLHRTVVALLGAAFLLFITYTLGTFNQDFFIISFAKAIHSIDFNVIFLLMALMIMVTITARTGVLQWLAVRAYALAGGNEWKMAVLLVVATAILSAFLPNVTVVILMVPVTVEIALILQINPLPLLMPEVFAANLGGTATLIGDPPNLLVGSFANFTFVDFLIKMAPAVVLTMVALIALMQLFYGRQFRRVPAEEAAALLAELKERHQIADLALLRKCLLVGGAVIVLFIVQDFFRMEVSIPALIGVAVLLVWTRADIVQELETVEWPSLIFFLMLFIVVGAVEEVGLIQALADWVNAIAGGSLVVAILLVLWVSAFASMLVDNIPFTLTMLPVVAFLTATVPGAQGKILYWALAFGACLGGNGTVVGASANIVAVGLAERVGYPITFNEFLKKGLPLTIVTLLIATVWLLGMAMLR
jgi:Na+/H+ antiporter NhaD/arsenite permease-like protein